MNVPVKKISLTCCSLLLCAMLFAQTDCVDYDVASYPKTFGGNTYPWNGAAWNFTNLKQNKISGLNFGNGFFKGLLEYLPDDYNAANTSVQYPIIIFFHGGASVGQGTAADLCRLFKDRGIDMATHLSIPGRVERSTSLFTQSYLTDTYKYIVVSPQFTVYQRQYNADGTPFPDNIYPSAGEVEQVIDYMVDTRYANKIDKRRIYLVGYSTGANMIMEYAGSSVDRAKRVAAVMPVSLCSQLYHSSNTAIGVNATNIAQAQLKTWFVYCTVDNCGSGPALNVPQDWVTAIKNAGGYTPRFTVLTRAGAVGAHLEGLYNCSDTLAHDAWSRAFDPNFKASFVGDGSTTNANDGINLNMYEWFTQQINAVLPVTLASFTARLTGTHVLLNWTTVDEKDNASFTILRAGADQRFTVIDSVAAEIDHPGEKNYSVVDERPLPGLNFYRLVQTDVDGKQIILQTKKILNSAGTDQALVYPNPVHSDITLFLSMRQSQRINVLLTSTSGSVIVATSRLLPSGTTELHIPASGFSPGLYVLKIEGMSVHFTGKIVKQ